MNQKTVSITRLKRVLDTLDYFELENRYIAQGTKLKAYREKIQHLEMKIRNIRNEYNILLNKRCERCRNETTDTGRLKNCNI